MPDPRTPAETTRRRHHRRHQPAPSLSVEASQARPVHALGPDLQCFAALATYGIHMCLSGVYLVLLGRLMASVRSDDRTYVLLLRPGLAASTRSSARQLGLPFRACVPRHPITVDAMADGVVSSLKLLT